MGIRADTKHMIDCALWSTLFFLLSLYRLFRVGGRGRRGRGVTVALLFLGTALHSGGDGLYGRWGIVVEE